MKLGINARTFVVEEPDGAVQTAIALVRELASQKDISVILYGSPELREQFPPDVSVRSRGFVSDSPFFGVVWERTVLPYLVSQDDIDLLFCPNGNAPGFPVNCPVVTYVHDVNAQKSMSGGLHKIYRKVAVPLGVRQSELIITVSNFSKSEIVQYLPINKDSVRVIYNGIDNIYLSESRGDYFDLPNKYLLYVGAMNPRKNVQGIIQAYKKIRNQIPHSLVLVGPSNKSVYKRMDINETADDIVTPGYLSAEQLKYAYTNASVFVYPSLYEGFGLPPLESMACGTPVVTSNCTSLPEVLNGHGHLVDPTETDEIANGILEVLESEFTASDIQRWKAHAQQFTWEQAGKELIDTLHEVYHQNE